MVTMCDLFEREERVTNRQSDTNLLVEMFRSHALLDREVKNALLQTRTKLGLRDGPKYMMEIFSSIDASVTCYGLARRKKFDVDVESAFSRMQLTQPEGRNQSTAIVTLERMLTYDDLTKVNRCEVVPPIRRGFIQDFCSAVNMETFVNDFDIQSHWKIHL